VERLSSRWKKSAADHIGILPAARTNTMPDHREGMIDDL